ncbi:DUF1294 domain-containing protein [Peptoniphilaceae bacterium SGI.131]
MFWIYYLVVINILTFFIYALDKRKAIKNKRRISERSLFIMAILGGSFGAVLAMYTVRHKTQKWYFRYLIPLIFVFELMAYIYFCYLL